MKKRTAGWLLAVLSIIWSPVTVQAQLVRGGVSAGRAMGSMHAAARVSKELAVLPAVEQALKRSFPASAVASFPASAQFSQLTLPSTVLASVYPVNEGLAARFKRYPAAQVPLLHSIFQARPRGKHPGPNAFSGTVFQITHNGKKEIYGVIAAHTLADHVGDQALASVFTADLYTGEKFISVPAKVVQVSAPSTLDLALVKFPAEVEGLLRPFEIGHERLAEGDVLQTQGFSHNGPVFLPQRHLFGRKSLYFRVEMELSPFERRGLCGSPLLDKEGFLAGVHIGSSYGRQGEPSYIGYATRAEFVQTLVDAYHNGGQAPVPFELAGRKIMDLNVDEYISYVRLVDQDESVIWYQMILAKFPSRTVEEFINSFSPRYVDFVVSRVSWNGEVLLESHGLIEPEDVWYRYDLLTQQLHAKKGSTK